MTSLTTKHLILGGSVAVALVVTLSVKYWKQRERPQNQDPVSLVNAVPKTNQEFVAKMKYMKYITNPALEAAMLKVDRSNFVQAENPFVDEALPIGFHATISAPNIACIGMDILASKITEGSTVLDVGSGSGYITAILAEMVGEKGRVVGIDHIPELVEGAPINIKKGNPHLLPRIQFVVGDGRSGHKDSAPYDAIYAAAAPEEIPKDLLSQLKPGGRMIIPVGSAHGYHRLQQVDVTEDGSEIIVKDLGNVRFVPLTEKSLQLAGTEKLKVPVRVQVIPAPDSNPGELRILRKNLGLTDKEIQEEEKTL